MKTSLWFLFYVLLGLFVGCSSSPKTSKVSEEPSRQVANDDPCEIPSSHTARQKQYNFMSDHKASISSVINKDSDLNGRPSLTAWDVVQGKDDNTQKYIRDHFYENDRLGYAVDALHATINFLAPSITESMGYRSLKPTFDRKCELFQEPEVKMVHALGTLAAGKMMIYPKLKKLDSQDQPIAEVENPFSGLLNLRGNEEGIPLLLRLSIANPVAHTISVAGKSVALEFIPGLGIKFLIDGERSIDLVAMESLAGQGRDQNFFKYEFSPDFSKHAPDDFNTSWGAERTSIVSRYDLNPGNSFVMGLVGKRFFQVIPSVTGIKAEDLDPHSPAGPHPFVISIQSLSGIDSKGKKVDSELQKRPWRLVFKPALDNLPADRKSIVTGSSAYVPGQVETDFRYKLGFLKPNDRLYYVIAETEYQTRFLLGEIVLESAMAPSLFADKLYFIQHQLDMRKSTFRDSIVVP